MLRPGSTCHIAVEHEPPVEPGGSVVKVQLGKSVVGKSQATTAASSSYEARELVTAPGCTIRDLVALAVAALGVNPVVGHGSGGQLGWHLCTTNWNTDRESAIDDLDATLEQVHVLQTWTSAFDFARIAIHSPACPAVRAFSFSRSHHTRVHHVQNHYGVMGPRVHARSGVRPTFLPTMFCSWRPVTSSQKDLSMWKCTGSAHNIQVALPKPTW